jgi:hypothetical protein
MVGPEAALPVPLAAVTLVGLTDDDFDELPHPAASSVAANSTTPAL